MYLASLISALTSVGTPFSFPQAHRKPFGWKATTARCPCWSPRLPCSCSPLAALELYVNRSTIIAIRLLILRSFQRKGLCNSGLKAKSTTFAYNNSTRDKNIHILRNQILKRMGRYDTKNKRYKPLIEE